MSGVANIAGICTHLATALATGLMAKDRRNIQAPEY
jgi:hypothetical protein